MLTMTVREPAGALDTDDVRALLLQLEYPVDIRESKTDQIIAEYRQKPEQPLLGFELDGKLVGLAGLAFDGARSAVIRHIVVRREARRRGIGRAMVQALMVRFALDEISAETDRDAVDFYRNCGFHVVSLGYKYPDTERFLCTLKKTND